MSTMSTVDCLSPTYPPFECIDTERFGLPYGVHGRNGQRPRAILVHCIQDDPHEFARANCEILRGRDGRIRRHGASYHWLVGIEGDLVAQVDEEDIASGLGDLNECPLNWTYVNALIPPASHPDEVLIHIAIQVPPTTGAYHCNCDCSIPTGFQAQSAVLVRLIAAIADRWNITINADTLRYDSEVRDCSEDCECMESRDLVCAVLAYCERPGDQAEASATFNPLTDTLAFVEGITTTGRRVRIRLSDLANLV